jgi:hypothetical protein
MSASLNPDFIGVVIFWEGLYERTPLNSVNQLFLVMVKSCDFFAVRTGFSDVIYTSFRCLHCPKPVTCDSGVEIIVLLFHASAAEYNLCIFPSTHFECIIFIAVLLTFWYRQ